MRLMSILGALWRNRKGGAAMFVAIGLLPVVAATGIAVDSGLGYILKSRLHKSIDTAGLAAGRIVDSGDPQIVARQLFDANFGVENPRVTVRDFNVTVDPVTGDVTITAQASIPTVFMRVLGQDELVVDARTVVQRQMTGIELALVLDNTGSMAHGGRFEAMHQASLQLVNTLFRGEEEVPDIWVSLVPYVGTVNIGTSRSSWLHPSDRVHTASNSWGNEGWSGCVLARGPGYDTDDTPPSVKPFRSFLWQSSASEVNFWPPVNYERGIYSTGPNLGCPGEIMPLTSRRSVIEAGLNSMWLPTPRVGTLANVGLAWGWRTISPRWRGLWGGETPSHLPLDYNTPRMMKAVVILTDGVNNIPNQFDRTAYGTPIEMGLASDQITPALNNAQAQTCQEMKDAGVMVFSIVFQTTNETVQSLFRNCASFPNYYFSATSNNELLAAFRTIGGQLASLRISE